MNQPTKNNDTVSIPFSRPFLGKEERDAVLRVLESGWLTSGHHTEEFETAFAEYLHVPFARAVNSATAGLHLALEASGVREGTRVITTPYTFTSTAEVLRYLGAHPLFVDIDEDTLNIDPKAAEAALEKPETPVSAILPVHFAGKICDIDAFSELAAGYGLPLIEDAAHAFPVYHNGRPAGSFGTAGVYSFYATKSITTGEGGMVVTDDEALADRISVMRLHGIDRKAWDRYTSQRRRAWEYDVVAAGYKYNLSDLAAVLGIAQLKKADLFLRLRRDIAHRYLEGLKDLDFLRLPAPSEEHSWHLFVVRLVPGVLNIDRDAFIDALLERGIATSVHYKPLHMMTYYKNLYRYSPEDFPVSLRVFQTCLSLPMFPGLTGEEVDRVIETVRTLGKHARR